MRRDQTLVVQAELGRSVTFGQSTGCLDGHGHLGGSLGCRGSEGSWGRTCGRTAMSVYLVGGLDTTAKIGSRTQ